MKSTVLLALLGLIVYTEVTSAYDLQTGDDAADEQYNGLITQVSAMRELASHSTSDRVAIPSWLQVQCYLEAEINTDSDSDSDAEDAYADAEADADNSVASARQVSCAIVRDNYVFAKWTQTRTSQLRLQQAESWLVELKERLGASDAEVSDQEVRAARAFMTAVARLAVDQCRKTGEEYARVTVQTVMLRTENGMWTLELNTSTHPRQPANVETEDAVAETASRGLSRNRRSAMWNANPHRRDTVVNGNEGGHFGPNNKLGAGLRIRL